MKAHRIYVLALGVVLPILALTLPVSAAVGQNSSTGASRERQQAIQATLQGLRNAVNSSVENLKRKGLAHQILSQELGSNMPPDLLEGLIHEIDTLTILQKANVEVFPVLINAEQSIADGKHQFSVQDIDQMMATVQGGFQQLDRMLVAKRELRQAWKKRLNGVVDGLIVANPNKAATYIRIKVELDPDALDREFNTGQKTTLASLATLLNVLR